MSARLAVFLDYQNVHLVGHRLIAGDGVPPHRTIVDPLAIAQRLISMRSTETSLTAVRVFRGRPNPEIQPIPTAANDAQAAFWQRDPRVRVIRRDLNYRGWPQHPPQEKGVDVALAVDLIEGALTDQFDVAVVFSSDTDLIPAIELAFHRTPAHIEIACWQGAKPLWFPASLTRQPRRMLPYCHFFDADDFVAVRDTRLYRRPLSE